MDMKLPIMLQDHVAYYRKEIAACTTDEQRDIVLQAAMVSSYEHGRDTMLRKRIMAYNEHTTSRPVIPGIHPDTQEP